MSFQFVEEGKWTRDAESLKLKVCRFYGFVSNHIPSWWSLQMSQSVCFYLCFIESIW